MTVKELISLIDELKPNNYSLQRKMEWLNQIEGQIFEKVIKTHANPNGITFEKYDFDLDGDKELIATGIYESLYRYFIEGQIDYSNQEINKYNNSAAMFNEEYSNYVKAYRREHMPLHSTDGPIFYKEG